MLQPTVPAPHLPPHTDRTPPLSNLTSTTTPSLLVEPTSLLFPPPHRDRAVQNVIVLSNIGELPCVFKIKARTPERYYAKPNIGVLLPSEAVRVRFILRPQLKDIPAGTQDQFRLYAVSVPPGRLPSKPKAMTEAKLKEVWNELDGDALFTSTLKRDIMCSFGGDVPMHEGAQITVLEPAAVGIVASSPGGYLADRITRAKRRTGVKGEIAPMQDDNEATTGVPRQGGGIVADVATAVTNGINHVIGSRENVGGSDHHSSRDTVIKETPNRWNNIEKNRMTIATGDKKMKYSNTSGRNEVVQALKSGGGKGNNSVLLPVVIVLMLISYGVGICVRLLVDGTSESNCSSPAAPALGTIKTNL